MFHVFNQKQYTFHLGSAIFPFPRHLIVGMGGVLVWDGGSHFVWMGGVVEEHFVVFEEGVIGDEFVEALVSGE